MSIPKPWGAPPRGAPSGPSSAPLILGGHAWRTSKAAGTGLVIHGLAAGATPPDYLHDCLLTPANRAAFFDLVDRQGLVVCLGVVTEHPGYRLVRGRSSKGKLSQGEYFHHDGCAGPVRPRIVEIRFPHQLVERHVATAVAPFPGTVMAMLEGLPERLAGATWDRWRDWVASGPAAFDPEWDTLQGLITRAVRRELDAVDARAWFRGIDAAVGAHVAPWSWGESRFIANNNGFRTMQHRRAYVADLVDGQPNGNLLKRWPAEELGD